MAVLLLAAVPPVYAQRQGIDVTYGRWWHDSVAVALTAAYYRHLFGPFDYGLGVTHLRELAGAGEERSSGGELALGLFRDGSGPYLVAGAGLAMRHSDGNFDAQWSAGGGYAVRLAGFLSLGIEARFRTEDRNARGFWRLDGADRRGLLLQARAAVGFGGGGGRTPSVARSNDIPIAAPSASDMVATAHADGASREAVEMRVAVVQTALDVMGTPYEWGGAEGTGFDCSGLIHYAYMQHGLVLPRRSRDQARTGVQVAVDVEALLPGDILGFSVEQAGITHVGLYVGDGTFIHSSSSGVMLSSLTASDTESQWWRQRWVAARRVIN